MVNYYTTILISGGNKRKKGRIGLTNLRFIIGFLTKEYVHMYIHVIYV